MPRPQLNPDFVQRSIAGHLLHAPLTAARIGFIEDHFDATGQKALWLYSGFLTRSKHNVVWSALPASMALLRRSNAELDLFASYRPTFLQRLALSPKASPFQRLDWFVEFVESAIPKLSRDREILRPLLDLVRHEYSIYSIVRAGRDRAESDAVQLTEAAILRRAESAHFRQFSYDPTKTISLLKSRSAIRNIRKRRCQFGYAWNAATHSIRIIRLSTAHHLLLMSLNDWISVKALLGQYSDLPAELLKQIPAILNRFDALGLIDVMKGDRRPSSERTR